MSHPTIMNHVSLAPYTTFGIGGPAEMLVEVTSANELIAILESTEAHDIWLLGYGSNTLVSDKGLPGLTIVLRGGDMVFGNSSVVVDAGVWWDDVVKASIDKKLWGVELLSEVPGSVGASLFINSTAYGQSVGPLVEWVDVWDKDKKQVVRLAKDDLQWAYKQSTFQRPEMKNIIILRTCLQLSTEQTTDLTYQKAVDVALEKQLDLNILDDRREIIIEARRRAGSLWSRSQDSARTAGSFFRNPFVSKAQLEELITFEEAGKTSDQIKRMNQVHGGDTTRVSAAHVLLAAGFRRGQSWGKVKLNDQNLLKIETLEDATAQQVHAVVIEIQQTVSEKLGILLEPEVRFLGDFS
jgi:UDP-N-acetylmuramate dehydrogenase